MAQKIDSEAHRPIPTVSQRIVSHIALFALALEGGAVGDGQ